MTEPSYESAVFDLFHTIVDPEEFRPKSFRRVEFVAQALNLDLQSFTSYWSNTLALRTTDRSQTIVKLIEAYLALHGKTFDEEAVARVDREMGRYQDMAILNPRPEIISALQILSQRGLKLGLLSDCDERDIRRWPESPLAQYFDAACFSCDIGFTKPDEGFVANNGLRNPDELETFRRTADIVIRRAGELPKLLDL